MQKQALILVGLSYTGKSLVGREIAKRIGWPFVDTDDQAVNLAGGLSIPDIFSEWGEDRFRALERQSLGLACGRGRAVIATGGGVVLDGGNRAMLGSSGVVFWLDARPSTIYQRLLRDQAESDNPVIRPIMQADDALERIKALKEHRAQHYAAVSDWCIATDALSPDEVVEEVLRVYGKLRGRLSTPPLPVPVLEEEGAENPHAGGFGGRGVGAAAVVSTSGGSYPVFVGSKIINSLPARLANLGVQRVAYVVSDENVHAHYGGQLETILKERDFSVASYIMPAGEASKSLDQAVALYDWLMARKAERGHCVVALGGGVVGDLAGFVAATYLRGMPLVHVPTTLLAMADASIGGKTAVNRAAGKNLVGSFYQPKMVLMDVDLLRTLGERELTEGWAEVIKHALIADESLLDDIEINLERLKALDGRATARIVAESAAIKAGVVSQDERETGIRAILNYGHTIGHGLENAAGYGQLLHGEAVAVGMTAAARIGLGMGLLNQREVDRQRRVLEAFGLPTTCNGIDLGAVRAAMSWDKKVQNGRQRWVLLNGLGHAVVRDDVPADLVNEALASVVQG
ncbi:MAG: 3-dehydroquinate synthase [Dehalococcoidia bacterium]|nr:3-dehydroquinate synthase [Dehalococcoidia bacterium]